MGAGEWGPMGTSRGQVQKSQWHHGVRAYSDGQTCGSRALSKRDLSSRHMLVKSLQTLWRCIRESYILVHQYIGLSALHVRHTLLHGPFTMCLRGHLRQKWYNEMLVYTLIGRGLMLTCMGVGAGALFMGRGGRGG